MRKFRFELMFVFVILACISVLIWRQVESKKVSAPLEFVDVIEESQTEEQRLEIAVMNFTQDEAQVLLERFERERKEAEWRATVERVSHATYSPSYFKVAGRIWWGGWSWTWYSERVLPGYGLRIPGRYTDSQGYVRDENGYLCLASDVHNKGTILETPFGSFGKVYDCGCGNDYTVDVYVGW